MIYDCGGHYLHCHKPYDPGPELPILQMWVITIRFNVGDNMKMIVVGMTFCIFRTIYNFASHIAITPMTLVRSCRFKRTDKIQCG